MAVSLTHRPGLSFTFAQQLTVTTVTRSLKMLVLKAGYSRRLRVVVQNLNQNFAESIRVRGHFRHIVHDTNGICILYLKNCFGNSNYIAVSKSNFIEEEIQPLLLKRKGAEYFQPCYNPLIVGGLFHEQAKPWEELARKHLRNICHAVRAFLELTVTYLTDEITSESFLRKLLDPLIDREKNLLDPKLDEILAPHQREHPITYNMSVYPVYVSYWYICTYICTWITCSCVTY